MDKLPTDAPQPRLCHLIKWPDFDGYGFNLHAEKAKSGQYIGKVDDESPAQTAGLRENDRIIEVNGVNIANENHRQVVERIKAVPNETKLLVLDEAADKWYKERKIVVKSSLPNVIHVKTPVPRSSAQTNANPMTKVNGERETNGNNVTNVHVDVTANNNKNSSSTNGTNVQPVNGSPMRQESPVMV
jgi:sodium/hydrogen exchange regulatory cofactor NHE-RF2